MQAQPIGPNPSGQTKQRSTWKRFRYRYLLVDGKRRRVHVLVWESAHGPVPTGMHVHHINDDTFDNRLENLEVLTPADHRRTHSPHFRRGDDGCWHRRCAGCGDWKPAVVEHFYLSPEGWPLYGRCRHCHIRSVVEAKQKRRAQRTATGG